MPFNNTLIDDENLSPDDPLFWSRPTPVNCNAVRTVGILLCVGALVGIIVNGALVASFIRYKPLRSPSNIFLMFIAAMGLVASCTILPLTGIIMTTFGFLITWTPYTIAFFLAAFRGKGYGTPPVIAFLCACFAKSSVVWIPIIYASTSTQFQWSFVKLTALEGLDPTNRVGPGYTLTNMNQGATNAREGVKPGNQTTIH
ncbi:unnamed protein product [Rotaria sp. Silwood2]|nr:unnamed protein product [Rotaria sp. Silwood2]CAF4572955.1 unnamed protein product [Rotaria sp. Silwood2]